MNELSLCQSWLAKFDRFLGESRLATFPCASTLEMSIRRSSSSRSGRLKTRLSPMSSGPNAVATCTCCCWVSGWPRHTTTAYWFMAALIARTSAGARGCVRSMPLASAAKTGCRGVSWRGMLVDSVLLGFDLGVGDDAGPFLHFAGDERVELLGLARDDLHPEFLDLLLDGGLRQHPRGVGLDLLDDGPRRAGGCDEPEQRADAEPGEHFGHRGVLLEAGHALVAHGRDHLHP